MPATRRSAGTAASPTLEAQAKASIETGSMSMRDTDAPVKVEVIVARIRADPAYAAQFAAALPGASVDIDAIVTAIAAFERTLEPGPAPFDAWVAGDERRFRRRQSAASRSLQAKP